MKLSKREQEMHRAALQIRGTSEITPVESLRAGEWERRAVEAAEEYARLQRALKLAQLPMEAKRKAEEENG